MSGETIARKSGVKIGSGCRILTKNFGSEPFLIDIGNNVTISSEVVFVNHDGSGWLIKDTKGRRYLYKRISIGNNVFVGTQTILMPGVRIGNNVVVGAGSVVTKSIPDNCVVAGNPAKYITSYDEFMSRVSHWKSESEMLSADDYEKRVKDALDDSWKPYLQL